jgi:hypothetical protein
VEDPRLNSAQPLTAEQVREVHELSLRLAGIFMPKALSQMKAFYERVPGQTTGRAVHYTTAEAALQIIQKKRIWMRNTICMTDYREVLHGFDIFNQYFLDATQQKTFVDAFEAIAPGVANEAIAAFQNAWSDIRLNTYIACLSEHKDFEDENGRLSMWRAFGVGTGTRVGIVFNIPYMTLSPLSLGLTFSPVAYLTPAEVFQVIGEVVANVQRERAYLKTLKRDFLVRVIFQMLVSGIVCLKHEGFREELEWRAIYTPNQYFSPLMESSTRVIGGVPQIVHEIPLDGAAYPQIADLDFARLFDRLIVGPTPYPWPISSAFEQALKSAGVVDAVKRIAFSKIPVRAT